jgi:PAS domain S-box-containing protein
MIFEQRASEPATVKVRILLVDADPEACERTRGLLEESEGEFEVECESTYAGGLAAIARGAYDAALLDERLGERSGIELLRELSSRGPHTPIILLMADPADRRAGREATEAGASDHLVKARLDGAVLERSIRYAVERKRSEDARGRLAAIIESSADAIIATTRDGVIEAWNAGAQRIYGYSADEVIGQPVHLIARPAEPAEGPQIFEALRRGERIQGRETVRLHRDGTPVNVMISVSPIFDAAGQVTGASATARDITERKRFLAELERREQEFRVLVERSPDIIKRFDRDGRHLYVNPAIELATGSPSEAFLGKTHRELPLSEEACRGWEEALGAALETGWEQRLVFSIDSPTGERTYEARLVPEIELDGSIPAVMSVARDITDRIEAEKTIRFQAEERERLIQEIEAERARLASIFMQAPAYICTLRGPDHVFETANPLYLQLTGHRELIGLSVRIACPELGGQGLFERLDEVYRTGLPFVGKEFPIGFQTAPGAEVQEGLYDFVYQPMTEPDGTIIGVFVHGVDVTESVQARQEVERQRARLAAAEAHYRRLVENSPYPIYALDREGRFTELNSAALETLGYAGEELVGRPFAEIIDPEDLAIAQTSFVTTLTTGVDEAEMRIVRRDGTRRFIHLRAAAIVEAGVPVGTQGVARDITEERARDERMRLLATALEGLENGVNIVDAEGRFVYANSAHARLYAYDRERLTQMCATDLLDSSDPRAEFQRLVDLVRQGTLSMRATRRRVDGQEMPVHVIIGKIEGGDRELFLVITRDITQELIREQQMQRAERLASMGTLLSGVAHELNNPLHAIGNFAELLLMEPRSADDREALEIVQREAERAAKVVQDLRVIARQTQDTETDKDLVDLNDVVSHVLKLRRYTIDTSNIELYDQLVPSIPGIWGSRPELEQVVLNLVLNAEQAMRGVETKRRLSLRTSSARGRVLLQISDTGPGIPAEIRQRIFDPFFTTKAPGDGTGLGLSLVHSIVTEHAGDIRVATSELGTTFTVDLPCAPMAEPHVPATAGLEAPARKLRVLVVDDERSIRRSIQIALERRGHHVELAQNGLEALRTIDERGAFDVILSDLRMPGLGGEQLLRHLKVRYPGVGRRVVFMTGDAASKDAGRILEETGSTALIKPLKLEALVRVVEEAGSVPPRA